MSASMGSGLDVGEGIVVEKLLSISNSFFFTFLGSVFNLGLFLLKSQCLLRSSSTAALAGSPAGESPFFLGVCSGDGGVAKAFRTMLNSLGIKIQVSMMLS